MCLCKYERLCTVSMQTDESLFALKSELTLAALYSSVSSCSSLWIWCLTVHRILPEKVFFLYFLISQRRTIFVSTQKRLGSQLGMEFTNNCHPSMA